MDLIKLENSFLREYTAFRPVTGTSLGIPSCHTEIADFSSARIYQYLQALSALEKDLKNHDALFVEDKIDAQLLHQKILLEKKELTTFCPQTKDPSLYLNEILYGVWFLIMRPYSQQERRVGILARLSKTRDLLSQAKINLKNPPALWVKIALEEIPGIVIFLKETFKEFAARFPRSKHEIRPIFEEALLELGGFKKYLRSLLKKSRGSFSTGKENFNFLLKNYQGFSENTEQILKIGKRAVEEVKEELEACAKTINPNKNWKTLAEEIKKNHPPASKLIWAYQQQVRRTKAFLLKKDLVTLPPDEKLKIIKTPMFTQSTIPLAAYIDPPLFAQDRTGIFFVTPPPTSGKRKIEEILREHSNASIAVTALHEGYPGHHLQFVYQANLKRPIRKLFNASSYYEGWALYCEEMMAEQGFYDAPTRFLQLKDKLWRACRMLVDVGLHTSSLGIEEAVDFLSKEAKMSKHAARADIHWYTKSPTVPLSYFAGMVKIKALRTKAEKLWGRNFSLKKFHDWFLNFGAIPISLIEQTLQEDS